MAWKIEGAAITLTRGDSLPLTVNIKVNNEDYTPIDGDVIIFHLKRALMDSKRTKYLDSKPLICKTIPVDTMLLEIIPSDTSDLAFGDYVYDMQITFATTGRVYTFINNERFTLAPEV